MRVTFDRKIKLVALAVVAAVGLVLAFSAGQIQAWPSLAHKKKGVRLNDLTP
jgi:hypothetical protein